MSAANAHTCACRKIASGGQSRLNLGYAAVVVQDATEDRQRHESTRRWRRLLQLWIRIRDRVDRLRRPRAIVIANVIGYNTPDVIDAEEQEVIQRFLTKRPDETLDVRGCVGRAVGDR